MALFVVVAERVVASEEGIGMVVMVVMSANAAVAAEQTKPAVAAERRVATYVGMGVALVIIYSRCGDRGRLHGHMSLCGGHQGLAAVARVGGAPIVSTAAPLSIPHRARQQTAATP